MVRILALRELYSLFPQGPGASVSMPFWGMCQFRGRNGLGRRSEAERNVTASKFYSLSSHLDIKRREGGGFTQLVLLEFSFLEKHAIKWLAHQWEISNPERWDFRAFVLAMGQTSNRHLRPSWDKDVGSVGGGYGWPFLSNPWRPPPISP